LVLSSLLEDQDLNECCHAFAYDYHRRGLNPFLELRPILLRGGAFLSEADVAMDWEMAEMDAFNYTPCLEVYYEETF
ncbi:hypothetical protein N9448_08545, partial [Litorivicinus sp.]|nr:hypothetical protein [Litorivicinus sp.]